MTNSYDVDHGLNQCHPGPLGLEAPDDTPARTGNTARDQEMYAAGLEKGEENAKHNAAIRVQAQEYGSPAEVAQRIEQYIGRYGREDSATLLLYEAMNALRRPAPAAGDARDARDAVRLDWLEQHDGRFYNKDRISSIVGTDFLVAGDEHGVRHQTVRAAIDAAIAAQRQGDA